jgi:hypothetical protein
MTSSENKIQGRSLKTLRRQKKKESNGNFKERRGG